MKFLSQINVNTEYTLPIVDGANGQVLATDGNGTAYWGSISAGATNLNALTDVVISSPSTGQLLRYGIPLGSEDPNPVWYNWSHNFLTTGSSIDALGDVTISTATAGQILQYNGTAWVNTTLSTVEYVSKVQHLVKAGVAITKGQAVYITGSDGTNMIAGLASNTSEGTSSKVMGLAASTAAINGQIFVVTEGLLAGLNTSTATAGDPVWLGANGNLIFGLLGKPTSPLHLVYIGVVTRVQQNNGEIFVKVQNGIEIDEIHDVQISSPATGQLLRRDTDGYWKNWTPNFLTSLPAHTHDDRYYTESEIDAFFGGETAIAGYNQSNWDAAYNDKINSASFATSTGVLTLTQQDLGTVTVDLDGRYLQSFTETDPTVATHVKNITATNISNWNDAFNDSIRSASFNTANGVLTLTQADLGTVIVDLDGRYITSETDSQTLTWTKATSSLAISNGNSVTLEGLATEVYVDTGLDTKVPTTRTLTINGTAFDLSANRSWTISTAETDTLATVTARGNSTSATIISTNNANVDGANFTVDTVNKTVNEYAYKVSRSGSTVGGILIDGRGSFASGTTINGNTAWHAGNDGSGSGLDADLLDGIDSSRFVYGNSDTRRGTNLISNWNQTDYPDVAFLSAENGGANAPTNDYSYGMQYSFHRSGAAYRTQFVTSLYSDSSIWVRNSRDSDVWTSWKRLWHSGDFTSTNVTNWNTAYGWGNHSGLYLPLSGGTLTGNLTLKYSTADSSDYEGLRFSPYSDAGLDDYIIKAASDKGVFGRKSFGWHIHTQSAFGVYSSGWTQLFGVEGGTGNTQVFGSLTVNGSITESSSIRYKKDVVDIEPASSKVELLRPVRYKKIKDESQEIGLIAEDVAELFPEVVKYDNEGRPDGVNYSRLSVILLKAVQELTERVNKLENK